MIKEPRHHIADEATFTRHLRGSQEFVTVQPRRWGRAALVGLGLVAVAAATFVVTPARSAEVKIIHVTPQNQTVTPDVVGRDFVRTVSPTEVSRHAKNRVIGRDFVRTVEPTVVNRYVPNQNAVRVIGE